METSTPRETGEAAPKKAKVQQEQQQQNPNIDDPVDQKPAAVEEATTSIHVKLDALGKEINDIEEEIAKLSNAAEATTKKAKDDENARLKTLMSLKDKRAELEKSFASGTYYGELSEFWELEASTNVRVDWKHFVRDESTINMMQCRVGGSKQVESSYKATREDALDCQTDVMPAASTRFAPSSQSKIDRRDSIWPTDIFGNPCAKSQEIAHVLPAGPQDSKEWVEVAAAATGLSRSESLLVKKKALRGVKMNPSGDGSRRKAGTGLVHFTSNKLRLQHQKTYLDGSDPQAMVIPVMSLAEAKDWKGEGYSAIFVLGSPQGVKGVDADAADVSSVYTDVGLTKEALRTNRMTRDAATTEIEKARTLLRQAILALGEYV